MLKPISGFVLAAVATVPLAAGAFSPDDHIAWIKANQDAQPQFVDGDVITYDKADLIRPFIPAEQQGELIFEGMEMRIKDAGDLSPADAYKVATEKCEALSGSEQELCKDQADEALEKAKAQARETRDAAKP